jgi:hypothetical protein
MLMLALNSYSSASAAIGTVYATGHVEVDGTYVPQSMTVVAGQSVKTDASSTALLQMPNSRSSILALQSTSLNINHEHLLTLLTGGLSVDTAQKTRTNIGPCAWVMPWDQQNTKYEIRLQGTTALVRAIDRPVTLRNDLHSIELQPNTVGIVENYNSPKCQVAYSLPPTQLTPELKVLLYSSYTTAAIVPWFFHQEMSSEQPDRRLP